MVEQGRGRNRGVNTADYKFWPSFFFLPPTIWWTVSVIPQVSWDPSAHSHVPLAVPPSLSPCLWCRNPEFVRAYVCLSVSNATLHILIFSPWMPNGYLTWHTNTHTHTVRHHTIPYNTVYSRRTNWNPLPPWRLFVAWLWHIPRSFQVSPWDTFVCFF